MTREQVLLDALEKVSGKREQDYGKPEDSFGSIAKLWTTWLHVRELNGIENVTKMDVAIMMTLMKFARLSGNMSHEDSCVDAAVYVACGAEIGTKHKEIPQMDLPLYTERKE